MDTQTYLDHLKSHLGRQARILNEDIRKATTVEELLEAGNRANVISLTFDQLQKDEK